MGGGWAGAAASSAASASAWPLPRRPLVRSRHLQLHHRGVGRQRRLLVLGGLNRQRRK